MINALETELEIERSKYAKYKAEKRNDYIALALLSRIEREIQTLEWRIDNERKAKVKHCFARSALHHVKESVRRLRDNCHIGYKAIHRVLKTNSLSKKKAIT